MCLRGVSGMARIPAARTAPRERSVIDEKEIHRPWSDLLECRLAGTAGSSRDVFGGRWPVPIPVTRRQFVSVL